MFYVKRDNAGRCYLATEKWGKLYESGTLNDSEPVAGFGLLEDAAFFLAAANAEQTHITENIQLTCPTDCMFYSGFANEDTCDHCIRKGNLRDYYRRKIS